VVPAAWAAWVAWAVCTNPALHRRAEEAPRARRFNLLALRPGTGAGSMDVRPPKDGGRTFFFCVMAARLITGPGPQEPCAPSYPPVCVVWNCWWTVARCAFPEVRASSKSSMAFHSVSLDLPHPSPSPARKSEGAGIPICHHQHVSHSRQARNQHPYGREAVPRVRGPHGLSSWDLRRGGCIHPLELSMPAQVVAEITGCHTLEAAQPETPITDQDTNPVHRLRRPRGIHNPCGD